MVSQRPKSSPTRGTEGPAQPPHHLRGVRGSPGGAEGFLGRRRLPVDPRRPSRLRRTPGPGWAVESKVGVVRVEEDRPPTLRGARLRPQPDALGARRRTDYVTPKEGTHVQVVSTQHVANPKPRMALRHRDGRWGTRGRAGYVKEYLILTDLPDPQAVEYDIAYAQPEELQWLVQNHKHFEDYSSRPATTSCTLAMAVVHGQPRTTLPGRASTSTRRSCARRRTPASWEGAKDKLDEYRRVLRPIFQAVELKLGEKIWLPGPAYVARLKDLNIVPTRPAWKNAADHVRQGG